MKTFKFEKTNRYSRLRRECPAFDLTEIRDIIKNIHEDNDYFQVSGLHFIRNDSECELDTRNMFDGGEIDDYTICYKK